MVYILSGFFSPKKKKTGIIPQAYLVAYSC